MVVAVRSARPCAGIDYPANLGEFFDWFQTDSDCWAYLVRLRWPDGFRCPACGGGDAWLTKRSLFVCVECQRQTSVMVGTVFEGSRLPLLQWFRAAWLITSRKSGVSASTIQEELGLGSYKTAWTLQHKLRKAMVRPERELLSGEIEVDETFVGGPTPGTRGRGTRKQIVAVAVEKPTGHIQWGYGRCRLRVIPNAQRQTLEDFITDVCEPGSVIYTDGHSAYDRLDALGFTHVISHYSSDDEPAHVSMPAVHRVASLLKRWLLGTHQGSVATQHLDSYLDEFTFRFNRRRSRSRGLLFYRLMQLAVTTRHTNYETIVWSRRGQMTKLRGRERRVRLPR
ncbi:MAG TPA: IS1595 family transposase [Gaiellaceae bacterium]